MKYTSQYRFVLRHLELFPAHKLKLLRLKRDEQINAVTTLYRFFSSNLKLEITEFDAEDICDIIQVAADGIVIKQNDDKQYFSKSKRVS